MIADLVGSKNLKKTMEMEMSRPSESFTGGIGVSTPTMVPETAIPPIPFQRWKRLYSQVIMNRNPLPPNFPELVEEPTENINVASSYSADDSDGTSTVIVPPPSDQTVVDIVEAAYMSGDQVTLLALNTGTDSSDQPRQERTRNFPCVEITISATGLSLEAVSAYFDQVATQNKLHYALYGMLLSIVAVLVCILDLIYNDVKQRGASRSASDMLWVILPEISGLALACTQCITASLHYSFLRRHATYPVRVSLVPFVIFFILFAFKYKSGRN